MSDVSLAIRMTADADDAVAAANEVGDAYERMAADVDAATAKTDASASRLDSVADSADGMASSSSQAAGGLGDLGGALSLLPGPAGAVGSAMEAAAPAIMGVTGASDLLNLVTKSTIVQQTRAKVAMVATTVAAKAQRAATIAAAVAQRVLNAAMRANPIGLIITGVLLIAAAFTTAFKRSETFRNIVNAVVDKVKAVVGGFIDRVKDIPEAFDAARDKVGAVLDRIREWIGDLADKVTGAAGTVRDKLGGAFDWVMDKVQPIIDAVQWIIDKLGSIDFPDIPLLRVVADSTATAGGTTAGTYGGDTFNIYVTGGLDTSDQIARKVEAAVRNRTRRTGAGVVAP